MQQYTRPRFPSLGCMVLCTAMCTSGHTASRASGTAGDASDATVAPAATGLPPSVGDTGPGEATQPMILAGTTLVLASNVAVCASTYHVGDGFTATVTDTVLGRGGGAVPGGAVARFRVTRVSPTADPRDALGIALDSIDIDGIQYPAQARIGQVVTRTMPRARAASTRIVIGTATGDVVGEGLAHRDSSVAGASAAPRVPPPAVRPVARDVCIPRHGRIALTLTTPERLEPARRASTSG